MNMPRSLFISTLSLIILFSTFAGNPAFAQTKSKLTKSKPSIILDVAPLNINISADFEGASVTVFGYVGGDNWPNSDNELPYKIQLAINLRGPLGDIMVRERSAFAGMWLPHDWIRFRDVPLYYDYALSSALQLNTNAAFLKAYQIGLNGLRLESDDRDDMENVARYHKFENSLLRLAQQSSMFPYNGKEVSFLGGGLFRVDFDLPNTIPSGEYQVSVILFDRDQFVAQQSKNFSVRQTGLLAKINDTAHRHIFLYAGAAFAMAILMGLLSAYLSRNKR